MGLPNVGLYHRDLGWVTGRIYRLSAIGRIHWRLVFLGGFRHSGPHTHTNILAIGGCWADGGRLENIIFRPTLMETKVCFLFHTDSQH